MIRPQKVLAHCAPFGAGPVHQDFRFDIYFVCLKGAIQCTRPLTATGAKECISSLSLAPAIRPPAKSSETAHASAVSLLLQYNDVKGTS